MGSLHAPETSDKVLSQLYLANPEQFKPRDWRLISRSGINSKEGFNLNSTDSEIMQAIKDKETMLLVPAPGKEVTYDAYKYEGKNPFQALQGMEFIQSDLPFDLVQSMITVNLTGKGRDIIVLFPNARTETVDVYTIGTKNDGTQVSHQVSKILS